MNKDEWLLCPVCKSKTRTRLRQDTTLTNFPLYCPKCKAGKCRLAILLW
ncbi:MAG: cysteine-rich KTR domain-containing protein [Clostridiales bacterium]|nr:cysteine-rich KTR domain-containing protein [Clostridiales bacterium]